MAACAIPEPVQQKPPRFIWPAWLERTYGFDLRSLALFRVALSALIVGDLIARAQDLRAFYTDWGALPRGALLDSFLDPWVISLHLMSGKTIIQAVLFVVAGVFALLMGIGWRTRLFTFLSWVMLCSIQGRNPIILQGGDSLFRMMVFWAMFLPLGAYASVDAALDPGEKRPPMRVFSAGTLGYMVQVSLLYIFAFLFKTGDDWRVNGDAVWFALSIQQMATPLGHWMLNFPDFLKFLTFFTLANEALIAFFLFFPRWNGVVRTVGTFLIIGLHTGFGVGLYLGHFPFVAYVMALALLPTWFWERMLRAGERKPKITVYYDGDCGFCKKMVLILRSFFLHEETPLLAAQSAVDPAVFQMMQNEMSWVVEDASGRRHTQTAAMAALLDASWFARPLGRLCRIGVVEAIGNKVYRLVEQNRPRLSKAVGFLEPRPLRWTISPVMQIVLLATIVYIVLWNVGTVRTEPVLSPVWRIPAMLVRVDQNWDMFSPFPLKEDGYYVIKARLYSGREVDLFRNGAPLPTRQLTYPEIVGQYKDERWRKYLMNLYSDMYAGHRLWFGRYLCRSWNEKRGRTDPDTLDNFEVLYYSRINQPPGKPEEPFRPVSLSKHFCWR